MSQVLSAVLVVILAAPAFAGGHEGKGKGKGHGKPAKDDSAGAPHGDAGFAADQRESARRYFVESYGRGGCPPGLAKKHNGCLPPGQAKKRYVVGRPLPRDVVYVDVPSALEVHIGAPPAGYRYVLVDGDLVKLVVGTMLVVDAIDGLVN